MSLRKCILLSLMSIHVYIETINFIGSSTDIIDLFGYIITYIRKYFLKS